MDEPRFSLAPQGLAPLTVGQDDPTAQPSIPGGLGGALGFLKTLLLGNVPGEAGGPAPGILALGGLPALRAKSAPPPLRRIKSVRGGEVITPGVKGVVEALRELGLGGLESLRRLSHSYGVRPGQRRLSEISSRRAGEGRLPYGSILYRDEVDSLLETTRKRYIELARQLHPDLGGDPEEMKKLNALYAYAKRLLEDRRFGAPVRPTEPRHPISGGSGLSAEDADYRAAWQKAYENYQTKGVIPEDGSQPGSLIDPVSGRLSGLKTPLTGEYINVPPPRRAPVQPGTPEWAMLDEIEKSIVGMYRGKRFPSITETVGKWKNLRAPGIQEGLDRAEEMGGNPPTERGLVEAYIRRYIEQLIGAKAPTQKPMDRSSLDTNSALRGISPWPSDSDENAATWRRGR